MKPQWIRLNAQLTTGLIYASTSGRTPNVSRFKRGLEALMLLTRSVLPPSQMVCPLMVVVQVFFGFRDAADKGSGSIVAGTYNCDAKFSALQTNNNGLNYRVGIWAALEELKRSYHKEFCNLVETMEDECSPVRLHNCKFSFLQTTPQLRAVSIKGAQNRPSFTTWLFVWGGWKWTMELSSI